MAVLRLLPLLLRLLMFVHLLQLVRLLLHLLHLLHADLPHLLLHRARTVAWIGARTVAWIGAVATRPGAALVHFPVVDLLLRVLVISLLHAAWLVATRFGLSPLFTLRMR